MAPEDTIESLREENATQRESIAKLSRANSSLGAVCEKLQEDNVRWVARIKVLEARAKMAEAALSGEWDWLGKKS